MLLLLVSRANRMCRVSDSLDKGKSSTVTTRSVVVFWKLFSVAYVQKGETPIILESVGC